MGISSLSLSLSLSLICLCMICSKEEEKKYAKNIKAKRIKMFLNIVASMFLGDVGVIRCTSNVIVLIKQL